MQAQALLRYQEMTKNNDLAERSTWRVSTTSDQAALFFQKNNTVQ